MCSRETVADYRPFCSRRCADLDLAKWLTGSYAIPAMDHDDPDAAVPEQGQGLGDPSDKPH